MLISICTALNLLVVATRSPVLLPEPAPDLRAFLRADPELTLGHRVVQLAESACAMATAHGVDPQLACAELDAHAPSQVSPELAARTVIALTLAFDLVRPLAPESMDSALRRVLEALAGTDGDEFLFRALPAGGEYWSLIGALEHYRIIVDSGGFLPVSKSAMKAKLQGEHDGIVVLRARLHQEDPAVGGDADPLYGDDVVDGLRRARSRYQLEPQQPPKRQLDRSLLDALAVPAETRVLELTRALRALRRSERWQSPYHVLVNLPEFIGRVRDADRTVHSFAIVAGSRGGGGMVNATPTLTSKIRTIIFNPQWVVPKRIFRKEMMSEYAGDLPPETDEAAFEAFWEDKGYELHGRTEKSRYLRLPPGPRNPLGKVKLLFENRHSVYLHDTPSKKLFGKVRRAFSHGCMRVEGPVALAEVLLRRDGTWPDAVEARVLEHWEETPIHLIQPVPLYVEYITVVSDPESGSPGAVRFLWDVYGRYTEKARNRRGATSHADGDVGVLPSGGTHQLRRR